MNRFFVSDLASDLVELSTAEAHHAMHVLRMKTGGAVELFDGRGRVARGEIVEARRGRVSIRVTARQAAVDRPRPFVHLAFAVPKGKRLDWLLEKTTELAASSLTPVSFERSVVEPRGIAGAKRERWLGHCVAAAKQSGLNWLPELQEPTSLGDYLETFDRSTSLGLVGSAEAGAATVSGVLAEKGGLRDIHLLVGPEGGLTETEYATAVASGFVRVRLGQTTLRIETACVSLLAAVIAQTE